MLETYEKNSRAKLTAIVVSVLVVAGVVFISDHIKAHKTTTTASTQTSASTTPATAASDTPTTSSGTATTSSGSGSATTTSESSYKDGTYTATSDYYVPHGEEEIQVSLTLSNGTITDASIQNSENDFDSQRYQEDFASAYKSYVVGKSISGLNLSVVSGASDTTQGFNDALKQIATKAEA